MPKKKKSGKKGKKGKGKKKGNKVAPAPKVLAHNPDDDIWRVHGLREYLAFKGLAGAGDGGGKGKKGKKGGKKSGKKSGKKKKKK